MTDKSKNDLLKIADHIEDALEYIDEPVLYDTLIRDMERLREMASQDDTWEGLDPADSDALEAYIERISQIPRKKSPEWDESRHMWVCPTCGSGRARGPKGFPYSFCPVCGQALDQ